MNKVRKIDSSVLSSKIVFSVGDLQFGGALESIISKQSYEMLKYSYRDEVVAIRSTFIL